MTVFGKEAVMSWKVESVLQQRLAMIHRIEELKRPVHEVAKEFGVSRKTANKWLARHRGKQWCALIDQSHRPKHSPDKTADAIEEAVVEERRRHNWGPRKIHRLLCDRGLSMPSVRTVANILVRRDCITCAQARPEPLPPQPFERPEPNQLWQLDHKGPIEVAREKICPLTVLDDCSRYCLCFAPVRDVTMPTAWNVLWGLFADVGMPESILCDNAFKGTYMSPGLSWFDARLVRLGIHPIHGRAYHPQTQGKVERLHGTIQRELVNFNARRDTLEHFAEDAEQWRMTYNTIRPHEALGDLSPAARWKPSPRPRPAQLPEVSYPSDAMTRRVSFSGDIRYHGARILVGRGLTGQTVRLEEQEQQLVVHYAWKQLRSISTDLLRPGRSDKMV